MDTLASLDPGVVAITLLVIGGALLLAELFTPSFGVLGACGIASLVAGALLLADTDVALRISRPLIAAIAFAAAAFVAVTARMALRQRRRPIVTGREELVGSTAVALEAFQERGPVRVHGETWSAETEAPVAVGEHVDVVGVSGLVLRVRRHAGASS